MENKECKGCKWNNYPSCNGTIMPDGNPMKIDNLRPIFKCGKKDEDYIMNFSIKIKSELELKIDELQSQINELKVMEVK